MGLSAAGKGGGGWGCAADIATWFLRHRDLSFSARILARSLSEMACERSNEVSR
jgi:hypothetical protein